MGLFERKQFVSHSGKQLDFKIECDALTDDDIETLAYIISKRFKFSDVSGVPSGGLRLADALKKYTSSNENYPYLIVDDVLTTGASMREWCHITSKPNIIGVVIFARGRVPKWVHPLFTIW